MPPEFGATFEYVKVFFAVFKELPVTIEEYVEGEFQKYVNNNGLCIPSPAEEFDEIYAKAQCLVHYSYQISERKLWLASFSQHYFKIGYCFYYLISNVCIKVNLKRIKLTVFLMLCHIFSLISHKI